ncbi:acetyl-CoA acyltransferase [Acrasis kona]|uniref:Acetyl-CoA acyltransferase n=1 Tax=Acrasis kona TaxID=1008807 RepID=A0AAW2Z3X3_9EUKA
MDNQLRRLKVLEAHIIPHDTPVQKSHVELNYTNAENEKDRECPRERAVIITGARTPFVKSFGELMTVDAIGLGVSAVSGLLQKTKLNPEIIDEVIWGNVVVNTKAPNVAREIIIDLNLPKKITGVTVSRACLSGLEAILQGVRLIESGHAQVVVAGGSDSTSNGEVTLPRHVGHALGQYKYGRDQNSMKGYKKLLKDVGNPKTWIPTPPAIAERSTGYTMGYHADMMAEINNISRESQDALAIASHLNAARARREGKFTDEIVPVTVPETGKVVKNDNLIREEQDPKKIAKLKPAFRGSGVGTVTAASSSALTDGASAVLIMSESKAKELGYPVDVRVKSYATTACDPFPQLLLAPALAIPKALDDAGITLQDVDLVEMHEAFAAQVLSTLAVLENEEFCKNRLGKDSALGSVDPSKLNPNGGSIAMGHPFSATGGRIVTSAVNELRRTGKKHALISICAAGGLGGVAILERVDENN